VATGAHLPAARALSGAAVVGLDDALEAGPDGDPAVTRGPRDPAVILYTSGSTGEPKGVLCDQRQWIHNARNYVNAFHVAPDDRLTLLSLATSQAMKNLTVGLLSGAAVFPADVRQLGLTGLATLMRRERVTITVMGASLFRSFCDALGGSASEGFPDLRLVRLGSEPVNVRDVELFRRHFGPGCLLVNGLASGETSTTRLFPIRHDTVVAGDVVPVGWPADDKTTCLVDESGRDVPPGEVGEIVVESPYLALGYWGRPDLTDAAFRPPAAPGGPRRYHTGDLGRLAPDGSLVCLGRKDARVKIRGHGVDLLEVETALRRVDNVREAAVLAHQNRAGYAFLVAYVVPATLPGPTNAALREALGGVLPEFAVPTTFVVLARLPQTASGKLDRQALPAPGRPYQDAGRPATPPRTPLETAIAAIWSEVLGRAPIDVHDHFYDLGGESLQAMRIMARIRKSLGVAVDLQALLDSPTVAELARAVAERPAAGAAPGPAATREAAPPPHLVRVQPGTRGRPVFFVPGGRGGENVLLQFARLARHVGPDVPFYGLRSRSSLGVEPAPPTVERMAAEYLREVRAQQPEGPYRLIGDCAGGIVAYEMAQQLLGAGQEVAALVLMDTPRPDALLQASKRLPYLIRLRYHWQRLRRQSGGAKLAYLRQVRPDLRRMVRTFVRGAPADEVEAIRRTYSQAIYAYRPRRYPGRIMLLVSETAALADPTHGWTRFALGGVETYSLPGDHSSYIREHIPMAAAKLRAYLEGPGPPAVPPRATARRERPAPDAP